MARRFVFLFVVQSWWGVVSVFFSSMMFASEDHMFQCIYGGVCGPSENSTPFYLLDWGNFVHLQKNGSLHILFCRCPWWPEADNCSNSSLL